MESNLIRNEEKVVRNKILKGIMSFVTIYSVCCWIISLLGIAMAVFGIDIPWKMILTLLFLNGCISFELFKYHTEYKYNM